MRARHLALGLALAWTSPGPLVLAQGSPDGPAPIPAPAGARPDGPVERLVDALSRNDLDSRLAAESALVRMGPEAVPALRELRGGAEESVRYRIDRVLTAIQTAEEARLEVRALVEGAYPRPQEAARRLRQIGAGALGPLAETLAGATPGQALRIEELLDEMLEAEVLALGTASGSSARPGGDGAPDGPAGADPRDLPEAAALRGPASPAGHALAQGARYGDEPTAAACEALLAACAEDARSAIAADPGAWSRRVQGLGYLAAPVALRLEEEAAVAHEALERIVAGAVEALAHPEDTVRRRAERTLYRLGPRARAAVEAATTGDDPTRRHAAARLSHCLRWRISERLYPRIGQLLEGYDGQGWQDRRSFLAEVERLGGREAIPFLRTALEDDPSEAVKVQAAYSLARLGDRSGFRFLEAAGIVPRFQTPADLVAIRMDQGIQYLKREDYVRAEAEFLAILEVDPENSLAEYNLACTYSLAGRAEEALDYLERSVDHGFDDFDHIRADEDLAPLRGHPRFRRLLEREPPREGAR
ncbi:MAG: tetratricopeptide repeat protein [Planctomycetes bacterium]|nr:tetratricopeptide repeat protein [Planctomycetota bacterium]